MYEKHKCRKLGLSQAEYIDRTKYQNLMYKVHKPIIKEKITITLQLKCSDSMLLLSIDKVAMTKPGTGQTIFNNLKL